MSDDEGMRVNRRKFLQGAVGAGVASSFLRPLRAENDAKWRTFEITTRVEVLDPAGMTRVWVPEAMDGNERFQRILGNRVDCEGGTARRVVDKAQGLAMVAAEFPTGVKPVLTVTSRAATRDWSVDVSLRARPRAAAPDLEPFLRATKMMPTDGIVREKALAITRGSGADVEKARAIYDWIVENTFRKPTVRGCGNGDIRFMLESGDMGGKCADLNGLYAGLARAAGLPARDVYGIRVAASQKGFQCLGPSTNKITKAQHCRAEVYLTNTGWVPVDPADVRKVVLEEPPGNRSLSDAAVARARAELFGSWEMNWVAYNYAQDVVLPGSSGGPVHFLMYPVAETREGRLDSLDPEKFRYEITAREVIAD